MRISCNRNGLPDVLTKASWSGRLCEVRSAGSSILIEIFPQHSVIPYEMKNSQPNEATTRKTMDGGKELPPQLSRRSDVRSNDLRATFEQSSTIIVEAMFATVIPSHSMMLSVAFASNNC